MEALKNPEKRSFRDNNYLKAFLYGLALSILVFVPFIAIDNGRFLFYGDFNVQQIPFYQLAHEAVRSGNVGWNQYTDLGANFIGSYSFYLLGSPFFWLTVPFPVDWLQFMMGPLLMLKFAFACLSGYVFLQRYVRNKSYAIIGGLLYAFSGFSVYNVFFNHFHEALIAFPLMLAALDEYMYKRRRGVFALTVAFCCITNYYFFVGQVTFTVIYFIVRLLCRSWRISLRDFLFLALESVLGVGLSCVLLVPSVFSVLQNDRTQNLINGWNAVLYNKNQRYLHILQSLFFPPDLPARPNFTPESESKWASLGAWLPLFGMTGVIGWLQLRRKHWLKKMLWILLVMAFVPFLNSAFQLENSSYYARWFYMLTLMMSLATIQALEYRPVNWKRAITWATVITCAMAGIVGFMPTIKTQDDGSKTYTFGLMQYPTRFWTYVAISLICLALVVYLLQFCRGNQKRFLRATMGVLSTVCVLYSVYFIALGKTQSSDPHKHIIPNALNAGANVNLPDLRDDSVRTDFYESLDNSGMFWRVKTIQAFHSIVPGSIMDFYDAIGVQRDVASRPDVTHYALRGLTSVKWLFDQDDDDKQFAGENNDEPQMPGWIYHGNANGFDIWENESYVPMGFCYDYYVSKEEFEKASETNRELLMMKAIVLDETQIAKFSDILTPLPETEKIFTKDAYLQDCTNRSKEACTSFRYTQTGFVAEISSSGDNLVFFSVPYEPGWTAKVNGELAEIQQVNVGFMAVEVPQGEKVIIEFTFRTPGLSLGILVACICILLLVLYLYIMRQIKAEKKKNAKKIRVLLIPQKFEAYADKKQASFRRPGALIPKQFHIPLPPEGPAQESAIQPPSASFTPNKLPAAPEPPQTPELSKPPEVLPEETLPIQPEQSPEDFHSYEEDIMKNLGGYDNLYGPSANLSLEPPEKTDESSPAEE